MACGSEGTFIFEGSDLADYVLVVRCHGHLEEELREATPRDVAYGFKMTRYLTFEGCSEGDFDAYEPCFDGGRPGDGPVVLARKA